MTTQKTSKSSDKSSLTSKKTDGAWTFFTNHGHVMILLAKYPEMILREVANKVGITERAVQKIVADLEDTGFIKKEKVGRSNHYIPILNKPLRHPIESHKTVQEVIHLINSSSEKT